MGTGFENGNENERRPDAAARDTRRDREVFHAEACDRTGRLFVVQSAMFYMV